MFICAYSIKPIACKQAHGCPVLRAAIRDLIQFYIFYYLINPYLKGESPETLIKWAFFFNFTTFGGTKNKKHEF